MRFTWFEPIPACLYLVRTGFSKIVPVTCKSLTFSPKNTGIKLKTMHARGIYEKVGQVTKKYTLRYDMEGLVYCQPVQPHVQSSK